MFSFVSSYSIANCNLDFVLYNFLIGQLNSFLLVYMHIKRFGKRFHMHNSIDPNNTKCLITLYTSSLANKTARARKKKQLFYKLVNCKRKKPIKKCNRNGQEFCKIGIIQAKSAIQQTKILLYRLYKKLEIVGIIGDWRVWHAIYKASRSLVAEFTPRFKNFQYVL